MPRSVKPAGIKKLFFRTLGLALVRVRPTSVTPEIIERIEALKKDAAKKEEGTFSGVLEALKEKENENQVLLYGAFAGNRWIGFSVTKYTPKENLSPSVTFVHPNWRGRGICTRLIRESTKNLIRKGIKDIEVETMNPHSDAAIRNFKFKGRRFEFTRRFGNHDYYKLR